MTLPFTPEINGIPNYFIEKIWQSISEDSEIMANDYLGYAQRHHKAFGKCWDGFGDGEFMPKIHTIRRGDRWKAGSNIHPIINSRQSTRFQFAPILKCISVQEIEISKSGLILLDGELLKSAEFGRLALNDGFEDVDRFLDYFKEGLVGQIVHWTDLRY